MRAELLRNSSKAFTITVSSHCSSQHQQCTESISAITCMPATPLRDIPPPLATSPWRHRTSISVGQTLGWSPTHPLGATIQEVPRCPSTDLIATPSLLVRGPVAPELVSPPNPILWDLLLEGGAPQVPSQLPPPQPVGRGSGSAGETSTRGPAMGPATTASAIASRS